MADHDDPATHDAVRKLEVAYPDRVTLSVKDREDTIAEKWNRIIDIDPDADVYMSAADDDPYVTPGYDKLILEAATVFPDGIGIVYGHMANASFPRVSAPTKALVEKTGYVFPPYFPYWFVDHWMDDLVKLIGRISFANVMTDQSQVGKTQEMREPGWWATWFDAAYMMRRQQAINIIRGNDFDGEEWEKETLIRNAPLIEFKSRWINNHVRAMSPQYEEWSGLKNDDPRYLRLKSKAIAMIPSLLGEYGMYRPEAEWFREKLSQGPKMVLNLLPKAWTLPADSRPDVPEVIRKTPYYTARTKHGYILLDHDTFDKALAAVELDGLFLEFGVAGGASLQYMQSLRPTQKFHGFDWFQGMPETWHDAPKGSYAQAPPDLGPNVELHIGLFEETLPQFVKEHTEPVAFLHVDCDLYESTKTVFRYLKDQIQVGTVIRFDEMVGYPGFEDHEYKAFNEFLAETGFEVEYLCHTGQSVACKIIGKR